MGDGIVDRDPECFPRCISQESDGHGLNELKQVGPPVFLIQVLYKKRKNAHNDAGG